MRIRLSPWPAPTVWAALALSALALSACAVGETVPDGGAPSAIDALFGCTVPPCDAALPPLQDAGGNPPPPPPPPRDDMGRPPDATVIPTDCDPGTRIGLCALCNLDGVPELPENDANCPPIDCGGDEVYERVVEGEEEVCYVTRRSPLTTNCRALGECHDDPVEFCGEATREEVERFVPGACVSMMGCQGAVPPSVEQAPPGATCNGTGFCDVVGECTVSGDCASFFLQGRSQFCEEGTDGGQPYCEFYLEPGGNTDCNSFCLANNWRCIRAWNDNGVCVRQQQESPCGQDYESHVCRCVPLQ